MSEIYLPATSEEKCVAIRYALDGFYKPLNVRSEVRPEVIKSPGGDDQYWIMIDVFPPAPQGQLKINELRQNYMTEVDKIIYGVLQRRHWRLDWFKTDQGQQFDCVLTKVFFPGEKVEKLSYKK